MEVFDGLRDIIGKIVRSGKTTDKEVFGFLRAKDRVAMLFGGDVQAYLDKLYTILNGHATDCTMEDHTQGDERTKLIKRKYERFGEIAAFYDEFPKLLAPYVQMHTKVP